MKSRESRVTLIPGSGDRSVHAVGNDGRNVAEQLIDVQLRLQQFLHLKGAEPGSGRRFLQEIAVVGRLGAVKTRSVLLKSVV